MPIQRIWVQKTSDWTENPRAQFFFHAHFASSTRKIKHLQIFSRIGKTIKRLHWIPNTILNTQCTCSNLIMSKPIYSWVAKRVINSGPPCETPKMGLFAKIVCNLNWKYLTILTGRTILDAWLSSTSSPELLFAIPL